MVTNTLVHNFTHLHEKLCPKLILYLARNMYLHAYQFSLKKKTVTKFSKILTFLAKNQIKLFPSAKHILSKHGIETILISKYSIFHFFSPKSSKNIFLKTSPKSYFYIDLTNKTIFYPILTFSITHFVKSGKSN